MGDPQRSQEQLRALHHAWVDASDEVWAALLATLAARDQGEPSRSHAEEALQRAERRAANIREALLRSYAAPTEPCA